MTMPLTHTVNTLALRVGDLVVVSGVILRLTELHDVSEHYAPRPAPVCFSTEYVGTLDGRTPEQIHGPFYGREFTSGRWAVQGNDLAKWEKIIDA